MTITIKLNTPDELRLLQPMMQLLQQSGVSIRVPQQPKKEKRKEKSIEEKLSIVERLHGVIKVPDDFDFDKELLEAISKKHLL